MEVKLWWRKLRFFLDLNKNLVNKNWIKIAGKNGQIPPITKLIEVVSSQLLKIDSSRLESSDSEHYCELSIVWKFRYIFFYQSYFTWNQFWVILEAQIFDFKCKLFTKFNQIQCLQNCWILKSAKTDFT